MFRTFCAVDSARAAAVLQKELQTLDDGFCFLYAPTLSLQACWLYDGGGFSGRCGTTAFFRVPGVFSR